MNQKDVAFEECVTAFEDSINRWFSENNVEYYLDEEDLEAPEISMHFDLFLDLIRSSTAPFAKDLKAAIRQAECDGVLARSLRASRSKRAIPMRREVNG
jgi:hypothetical protein